VFYYQIGLRDDMVHTTQSAKRNRVTLREYYAYRLSKRQELSIIHLAGDLFQQFVVDAYVKIESNNLNYIRQNQTNFQFYK
jgi:hypothetical protein